MSVSSGPEVLKVNVPGERLVLNNAPPNTTDVTSAIFIIFDGSNLNIQIKIIYVIYNGY